MPFHLHYFIVILYLLLQEPVILPLDRLKENNESSILKTGGSLFSFAPKTHEENTVYDITRERPKSEVN